MPYKRKAQTKGPHLMVILEDISRFYKKTGHAVIMNCDNTTDEYVICRRLYCYVAWRLTNASLQDIGYLIGRDHTNVMYHRDTVADWIKNGQTKWIDEWLDWLEATKLWGKSEKIRN